MSLRLYTLVVSLLLILYSLFSPPVVEAQTTPWGSDCTYTFAGAQVATLQGVSCLISNVLVIALQLIGLISFVMILVGAIKILISGGNPEAAASGKQTLTFAVGGLVLALLAWFLLSFIQEFTGVEVTIFKLPFIQ